MLKKIDKMGILRLRDKIFNSIEKKFYKIIKFILGRQPLISKMIICNERMMSKNLKTQSYISLLVMLEISNP